MTTPSVGTAMGILAVSCATCGTNSLTSTRRRIDSSAVSAFLPVLAVVPLWLLALAIVWLPLRVVWHIPFLTFAVGYLAAVLLLFFRPVQVVILAPLLGARRPTRRRTSRARHRLAIGAASQSAAAAAVRDRRAPRR